MRLLVKNGKAFIGNKLVQTNILCEDGRITGISPSIKTADNIYDAKDKVVLPGFIDPHVHFRDPGLTRKEDFRTGSRAAAKGGITSVIDMPNTLPPVTTVKALEEKRAIVREKSVVNYGFHFGAAQDNLREIKEALADHNIASVKVYLDITTGNLKIDDHSILKDIFSVMPVTALHAENDHISSTLGHLRQVEDNHCIYLCHISSARELQLARQDNTLNHRVFVEATPQHLFMTQDDVKTLKGFAEMRPRLKTKQDQKALWEGIQDGEVDTIGTDHAPHTRQEKEKDDYPFGIPGEETLIPLMMDAVNSDRLTLPRLVQLCSINPAKIFGLKGKGAISKGYDADLTIVDPGLKKKVDDDELLTRCGWSPWHGKLLKGWPVATIVNGNLVHDDGEVHDIPGRELTYEHRNR